MRPLAGGNPSQVTPGSRPVLNASELPARWQSTPEDDVIWYSCGEHYIAYLRTSGQTHFLNASSFRLISELLRVPSSLQAVVENFASPGNDLTELEEELKGILEHFEELGLIQKL